MTLRKDSTVALEGDGGFKRVLVPVDFTENSRRALDAARSLVSKDGSIILVHVVVDANGDVRACELRRSLGNLRDFDCDWNRFWESHVRREEIAAIAGDGCWCTHVCFIHASLKASAKTRMVDVPLAYLGHLRPGAGRDKVPRLVPETEP